nr:protamine mP2 intermediate protein pmP2/20 [mice, Peptide Partial, 10 aa] [Mus sp.]
HEREEQGQGQ